ncbi:melanocyte protein PMEL-like isoform X2 [Petromyzon marinus]|uniref:melanocyte protein PMEL-like isoform X2 n=1 Tax=Petromyzon marinus TaxID=7757 RepID=UPI003F6FAAD9
MGFEDVLAPGKDYLSGAGGSAPHGWQQASAAWNDTAYPVWPPNDTRWESNWRGGRMKVMLTSDGPALVGSRITFYSQLHFPRGQRAQPNGRAAWAQNGTVDGSPVSAGDEVYPELSEKGPGGRRSFPDGRPMKRGRRDEDYVYVFYTRGRFWEIGSQVTATVTIDTKDIPLGVHVVQLLVYQERHNNQFIPLGNATAEYTVTDQIPFSVEISQLDDQNYLDNRFVENRDVIFTALVNDPSGYLRDSIAELTYTWNFGDESGSLITQMPTCRHAYPAAGNYRPQLVLSAIIPTECGTLNATVIPDETTRTTTTTTTTTTATTTTTTTVAVTTAATAATTAAAGAATTPSAPGGPTTPAAASARTVTTEVPATPNPAALLMLTAASQLPAEPDGQTTPPPSTAAPVSQEEAVVVTLSASEPTVEGSSSSVVPAATVSDEADVATAASPSSPASSSSAAAPAAPASAASPSSAASPAAPASAAAPASTAAPASAASPAAPSEAAVAALRLVKRQAVAWRPPHCQVHRYGSFSTHITVVPEIQSVKVVALTSAQAGGSTLPGLVNFMVTCEGSLPTQVCTVVSDAACVRAQSSACRNVSGAAGGGCEVAVQESFNASGTYCLNVTLSDDVSLAVSSTQVTVGLDGSGSSSALKSAIVAGVFLAIAIAGAAVYVNRRFKEYSPVYQHVAENGAAAGGSWASYAGMRRLLGLGRNEEASPLLATTTAATGRIV